MRKGKPKKRTVYEDYIYSDVKVTKFINALMVEGKKLLAERIFYNSLDKITKESGEKGYDVWVKALSNVTPLVEVRSRRVGGSTFQVPTEVRTDRGEFLARKWLIKYARERTGKSMSDNLASEILAAYKNEGLAFKRKEDTHKMAEANKAFSHFRF